MKCAVGISITASHNPQIWNGLKFLNSDGTFLDEHQVGEFLKIADKGNFRFAEIDKLKSLISDDTWINKHIDKVLELKIIDVVKIRKENSKQ
ncbi:MAG: hypothetical protein IPN57_04950 [Ignavibacteria bacterium]|nr:hypothetical protein [Ignavibacteria bacterium]